ncbi:hypothetical protein EYF80_003933 [Liparis tanakae]|uniref:Uncharacterized protein n=1 Tax=Liparis tanakae TaxID=230148 RepID=A0A4Z2J676_9TELE|nr:hypothetical protein EYF80_003933 [Liparis tanakae]
MADKTLSTPQRSEGPFHAYPGAVRAAGSWWPAGSLAMRSGACWCDSSQAPLTEERERGSSNLKAWYLNDRGVEVGRCLEGHLSCRKHWCDGGNADDRQHTLTLCSGDGANLQPCLCEARLSAHTLRLL